MTISSNTYADKIYSENPIALWALDEELPDTISGNFSITYDTPIPSIPYLYTGNEAKAYKYGSTTDSDYGYYTYLPFAVDEYYQFLNQYLEIIQNGQNIDVNTLYTRVSSDSVPLVYGSSNVAEMYPTAFPNVDSYPSIILPGKGFLNESNKYSDMTLEFWIKSIASYSPTAPTRIVGPIASDDGLYLYKRSLILKIGNNSCSAFISGFNRPILIDLTVSATSASIIVNGEILASMVIDMHNINLPAKEDNSLSQDWLAFYANFAHSINLDCVAIYNYCVPDIVAKKRFAYGQAVEHPQSVLAKHGGQTYAIDGSFANFNKTVKFPQTNSWQSGTMSNLVVSENKLKFPEYSLPEFYAIDINENDISKKWYSQDISLIDYNTWNGVKTVSGINFNSSETSDYKKQYIAFNGLPVKSSKLHSIMIQMQHGANDNDLLSSKLLFKLLDKTSQDYLVGKIYFQEQTDGEIYQGLYVKTYFVKSETSPYSYSQEALDDIHGYIYSNFDPARGNFGVHVGENDPTGNAIGLDFSYIKANNPESFLNGNSDNWILYVGGDDSNEKQFFGKISKVMFVDSDIADYLPLPNNNLPRFVDGKYTGDCSEDVTYSLVFNSVGSYYYPDIALCGYWLQNVPFSRLTSISNGLPQLDFIQLNDFVDEVETYSSYKIYASISDSVDNDLDTLFATYSPTMTDGSILVSPKANNDSGFNDQYINLSILLRSTGIFTENPVVNKVQLSSRINGSSYPIGSKFGISAYAFGSENKKVLYSISMDSRPYNYMTGISGISLLGQQPYRHFDGQCDSGIRIPINYNNSNDFYIQSLQFYYRPIDSSFESFVTLGFGVDSNNNYWYPLFDIYSQTSYTPNGYAQTIPMNHLRVKAIRVSNRAVKLVCVNISDNVEVDITNYIKFTINGHTVNGDVLIETLEWSTIGILFPTPLNMSGQGYSLDIIGPGTFNNIVYLKIPKDDLFSRIVTNTWEQVYTSHTWNDILSINTNWQDAYLDQVPAIYTITPEYLYNLYQGTNRIVVASSPQKSDISIKSINSTVYKNVLWLSENIKPV